jgi:hypothetical protein
VLEMNHYKYVLVRELVTSENVSDALAQLGAASEIGDAALRAIREGDILAAVAWAKDAASNALDLLGRDWIE